MKRTRVVSATLLFLVVGGSAMAQGKDKGKKADRTAQGHPAEGKKQDRSVRVQPAAHQQRVEKRQQKRVAQPNQHLKQRVYVVQQPTAQLQQKKRAAHYRVQQEYAARLLLQRQRLRTARNSRDRYITTPYTYRYIVSGTTRQTNQSGADVLRQAVNYGYQEGFRSGQADRLDNWASNYQNSAAYRDASYGYDGNYIVQSDYNYYFRQGFRRGYDDGYNSRSQYGTSYNGTSSILGTVVSAILGLQSIR